MCMEKIYFGYSYDNERYWGRFESEEEALKEAVDGLDDGKVDPDTKIYIGELVCDYVPRIDTDKLLEDLNYDAYDKCGECAEDYLEDVIREDFLELDEKLNKVFAEWLEKHGYLPDFASVPCFDEYVYADGKFVLNRKGVEDE